MPAFNKVYDGNTTAQIVNAGSLTGLVQGDSVNVSNTGATFANKNAGINKTVTLNGVAISGTDAGNYSIAGTATDTADITQKTIALAGFEAANKTYDGNTTASVTYADNRVSGDVMTVSGTATFSDKDIGTGKTVLNGFGLDQDHRVVA